VGGRVCLRDILSVRLGLNDAGDLPPALRDRLAALAARHPAPVWLKRLGQLDQTARYLAGQANAQLAWEMLWLKMARTAN
jgi:hypothetical protein